MNRDILFRGKTEPDGHWVYGSLISRHVFIGWLHWITYQELVDKKNELWADCETRVKSETVGQYTGIKIGGQKLFEHDVVRYRETGSDDWQYGVVVWCGDRDYPAFDVEPWIDCDCNGLSYIKVDCEVEIVGNKWDNPELLEVLGDE